MYICNALRSTDIVYNSAPGADKCKYCLQYLHQKKCYQFKEELLTSIMLCNIA